MRTSASLWIILCLATVLATACGASRQTAAVQTDEKLMGGTEDGDFKALVDAGDQAWAGREDRAQLQAAIDTWEKAVATRSEDMSNEQRRQQVYSLYVSLARAYYFMADGHIRFDAADVDDVAEPMMKAYDKGAEYAEKAMALYSPEFKRAILYEEPMGKAVQNLDKGAVPAMYWWASNIGKWALIKGIDEALGRVDSIKATMERVLELDPAYFNYGPYRYFGGYYTKLPFPGGDLAKSKQFFAQALDAAPDYLGTRVLYAELYAIKADEKETFEQQLQAVLEAADDPSSDVAPENAIEKKKAKLLLDSIDDHV